MSKFKRRDAFRRFAEDVRFHRRYMYSGFSEVFLKAFLEIATRNVVLVGSGTVLARAQRGNRWQDVRVENEVVDEMPVAFEPGRMKPRRRRAFEGRVNPSGIPYLYLADDVETALAETRPAVGDLVTVGHFRTVRDLSLVDFTSGEESTRIYIDEPPDDMIDAIVWNEINVAFSTPVSNDGDLAAYVPTQVLAEHLRDNHCDGVKYRSRLGNGANIALFDLDSAQLRKAQLYEVKGVEYSASPYDNPYFAPENTTYQGDTDPE